MEESPSPKKAHPKIRRTVHHLVEGTTVDSTELLPSSGNTAVKPQAVETKSAVVDLLKNLDDPHRRRVYMGIPSVTAVPVDIASANGEESRVYLKQMSFLPSDIVLHRDATTLMVDKSLTSGTQQREGSRSRMEYHPPGNPAAAVPGSTPTSRAGGGPSSEELPLVTPQLDWWEGPVSRIPHARTAMQSCGAPFDDVSENVFLAKEIVACVSSHVDQSLRLSGLIKQTGRVKTTFFPFDAEEVVFDEATMTWVNNVSRMPSSVDSKSRQDLVPAGIISVVGTLNLATFGKGNGLRRSMGPTTPSATASTAPTSAATPVADSDSRKAPSFGAAKIANVLQRKDTPSSGGGAGAALTGISGVWDSFAPLSGYDVQPVDKDDADKQMIMVIGDPDSEFLERSEVIKFVKHYLTRSIIKAAKTAGASIVVSGVDDLSRQLGIGYQALVDPVGIRSVKRTMNTQLVGINSLADQDRANLYFSHNILLKSDGGHVFDPNADALRCTACHCTVGFDREYSFCPMHSDFDRVYRVRQNLYHEGVAGGAPDTTRPLKEELRDFKQRILENMNQGFHQRLIKGGTEVDQPPNRDAVPVALILIGGDESSKMEVHAAVSRNWPILIVEGSEGYADILCSTIDKVCALTPEATQDDYRSLLSSVDAVTSEIIVNGKFHVIKKGTDVAQVERKIINALKGDEILHQAWKLYSIWRHNEREWYYFHQLNQLTILMLGIMATLASVTQTFLILLYGSLTAESDFVSRWSRNDVKYTERYWYLMFRLQQWLVIGLPITLSLVHAIFQRMNPWAKLSALRIASSSLLREIYVYRTKTLMYSNEAVKASRQAMGLKALGGNSLDASREGAAKAKKLIAAQKASDTHDDASSNREESNGQESSGIGLNGVADPSRLAYSSREELLGIMIRKIQVNLGNTDAGTVLLEPPKDSSVPPASITTTGDSGLSVLTPDDYVAYRLIVCRREYDKRHAQLENQHSLLTFLVILFGAVGTALAALSAYGLGYLQAWVAFSTVVVNSLTRFLDFTRTAAMSELCNTAEHRLTDVERWWASLGTDADSDVNRTKLVTNTEKIIQDELDGWSKQMQNMDQEVKQRTAAQDDAAAEQEMDAQTKAEDVSRSIGVDLLESEQLVRGLLEKEGPLAQRVKRQILDLNDKLGHCVRANSTANTGVVNGVDSSAAGPSSMVTRVASFTADPYPVPQVCVEPASVKNFLAVLHQQEQIVDCRALTLFTLRRALMMTSSHVAEAVQAIPSTLHIVRIAKAILLQEFSARYRRVLTAMQVDMTDSRFLEEFVSEMSHAWTTFGKQIMFATKESLAQVIESPRVQHSVLLLGRRPLRYLIETTRRVFEGGSRSISETRVKFSPQNHTYSMSVLVTTLKSICAVEAYEVIHVRILGEEAQSLHEDVTDIIPHVMHQATTLALPLELSPCGELRKLSPPELSKMWDGMSGFSVVEMVRLLGCGTSASRTVKGSQMILSILLGGSNLELLQWVQEPSRREILASANGLLTQLLINRSNKTDLLRSLQASKSMTKELADSLSAVADEHSLKAMLSVLQARDSNTFACNIVQKLADSFFLVDYKDLLSGDEMECLVNSVSLLPKSIAVSDLNKDELLLVIPLASIRRQLESLDEGQLHMLFHVQRLILERSYFDAIWTAMQRNNSLSSVIRRTIEHAIHPYAAQRLIFRVMYLSEREQVMIGDRSSFTETVLLFGDAVVSSCLLGLCDNSRQETSYAIEFQRIIDEIRDLTHEKPSPEPSARTVHPLLLRLCYRIIHLQPLRLQDYAKLFFRMLLDPTSADLSSLMRLVNIKADDLLTLEVSEIDKCNHTVVTDMLSYFSFQPHELDEYRDMEDISDLRERLYATAKDRDALVVQLRNMLVEMDIFLDLELPYMVFEEIAQKCTQFDLRDIIVNPTDRQFFAISWFEFCDASEKNTKALRDVCDLSLLHNDRELAIPFHTREARKYKEHLFQCIEQDAATNKYADLDLLSRTVRNMDEVHVVQLGVVLDQLLFFSSAGRVFSAYCINRRQRAVVVTTSYSGADAPHPLSLEQIGSYILSMARGNISMVTSVFCNWDDFNFQQGPPADTKSQLRRLIPNDDIIDGILSLDEARLRWLFIMTRFTLFAEQRRMHEDAAEGHILRKTFESEVMKQYRDEGSHTPHVFQNILSAEAPLYDE